MADAPEAEEGKKKKKGGFLKYVILVVLLRVLGGGGYFAYLKFFSAKPPAPAAEAPAEGQPAAEDKKAEEAHAPKADETNFFHDVSLRDDVYGYVSVDTEFTTWRAARICVAIRRWRLKLPANDFEVWQVAGRYPEWVKRPWARCQASRLRTW